MTDRSDVRPTLYIQNNEQLQLLCQRLAGSKWLAVDTEFLREKTYYPKLCLLQVANESLIACIDPLALDDLSPLFAVLYDTSIVKILHSARQDYEIFFYLQGRLPEPVFDTQIAALLCSGDEQISYAALVKQVVDVDLEKGCTRTDWSRRPLADDQLSYAQDDVRYLGDIYHAQAALLDERGLLGWLQEECESLVSTETYEIAPEKVWLRIKEARRMKSSQLVLLQGLAAWRELQAVERDKPRKWILRDEVLVELAIKRPATESDLAKIHGLTESFTQRHGAALLAVIATANQVPASEWPVLPQRLKRTADEVAMIEGMMALVHQRAQQRGVTSAVLAGKKDIEALLSGEQNSRVLQGWRYEEFGKTLQSVLTGETKLSLVNGQLVIELCG